MSSPLVGLASIVVLGVAAQWVAARLRVPSILLLLGTGILVGPVAGWLAPDLLFGELLLPSISIAVGLILYDGGLNLRFRELADTAGVLGRLVTVGVLATWVVAALAAYLLLDLSVRLAVLLGAVLVVTGPTVIIPLLRHMRPVARVGNILKWEGIVIDPVGALLAVLVFEVVVSRGLKEAPWLTLLAVAKTVLIGGGLGVLAAVVLVVLIRWYWVPDHLQNPVSLALAVATFTASNLVQAESGLFATTVMGVALANQRFADIRHIVEFKENLGVLLVAALFMLLGARLTMAQIRGIDLGMLAFIAVLIVVGRPLGVLLSTWRSQLAWRERILIAWMAPRGIVAAAVSSIFALGLEQAGWADAEILVTATFAVIIGTVAFYGLTAPALAFRLRLAEREPQGLLIVGADAWQRAIAKAVQDQGYRVLLVDTNFSHVAEVRMAGLSAVGMSILSESFADEVDMTGIGRLLALTPNDWVNERAVERFSRVFGKANVYQLPSKDAADPRQASHAAPGGRPLFGRNATYEVVSGRFASGTVIKATPLTEQFDYKAYAARYGTNSMPLFVITEAGKLRVVTAQGAPTAAPGEVVIGLVDKERAAAV